MKIYIDIITVYLANIIIPLEKKNEENVEIVSYGICSILTSFLNLSLSAITLTILGYQSFYYCFLLFFIPIRCLHKGFHCKTLLNCLVLTNILFTLSTLCCFYFNKSNYLFLTFISILFIHYYISIERRKLFHIGWLCVFIVMFFVSQHYLIFPNVAMILDTLLIIGGKISEIITK